MNIDWQSIRAIDGSKAKGFEELIVQLARAESPSDALFKRVGTPDAGVECYCVLKGGSEWGWQAKHFTSDLNNSQWAQLDDSIKTALDKRPSLTRYYVCIPWDRSDARIPGQKSAMQRWNEHVSKWQGWARERDMSVEFVWWGASELIERLSQPAHIGRISFWFNVRYFDKAWYNHRLQVAIDTAGPRYTPEVHVDLPIAQDMEMFGRTDAAINCIKAMAREVRREFRTITLPIEDEKNLRESVNVDELAKRINKLREEDVAHVLRAFSDLDPTPDDELPIADIVGKIEALEAPTRAVVKSLKRPSEEYDSWQRESNDRSGYQYNPFRNLSVRIERLRYRLQGIVERLDRAEEIGNRRVMILKGDAGTGKTHLLCDVARSRIVDNAPTVLLMGQRFTDLSDPWTQTLQHLGLHHANVEQFIGALEASAQSANRKALLIIDAVNEGHGRKIWPPNMSAFLTQVERSPWVGVILSVRSSYEESVIPADVRERAITVTHDGFTGHEYDAVRTFAEHYGIEFPSTPILQPEFRNPLFLKIICEGLQGKGERRIPRGISGVTNFFNLYLNKVNERLAELLDYNPNDNLVRRALEKVAERIIDLKMNGNWLPRRQVEEVVNELLPGRRFSDSLYRNLVVEGVLAEDLGWRDGESEDVARFAYERLSDHIIANFLLQKFLDLNDPKAAFTEGGGLAFLCDRSTSTLYGIVEAMCVQVPERTGQELVRLAPALLDNLWNIGEAFLQSIIWRKTDAFSDDTIAVLNELTQKGELWGVLDTILTVATVPNHRLNADFLDERLRRQSMPDRDAWWSTYLHRAWREGSGAIHRLVDWACAISMDDDVEDDVVNLSATALAWMFSTSNRFLRDKAPKGLVSLLTGRINATVHLVNQFDAVDEPYVRERVYAVAYGVAMRSHDACGVERLGMSVYENIFASGNPPPHILLRDYARGVVERALHLNSTIDINQELLRPPYKSDWPDIPDDSEIEMLTPHWNAGLGKHGTPEWARNRIRWSVTDDDFARYVIGTNFSHYSSDWLSVRLDEGMWQSPDERLQILLENMSNDERLAWDEYKRTMAEIAKQFMGKLRFLNTLPNDDDATVGVRTAPDERERQIESARVKMLSAMTEANRSETEVILRSQSEDPPRFDLRAIQRYIIWRVFDLGWTVDRFGCFDSISIGYSGRDARKAERIGKKYQWIAYHEMLAYLADNYQHSPEYNSGGQAFQGAWQKFYRDIDPSCVLTSTPMGVDRSGHTLSWWTTPPYDAWNEEASHQNWLDNKKDIPEIEGLLRVTHPKDGTNWLVVDGSFNWQQPLSPDAEPYGNPKRDLWISCQGYFTCAADAAEFINWAKGVDFWGRWMPEPIRVISGNMFLGEYAWAPAFEYFIEFFNSDDSIEGWSYADGKCPVPVLPVSFSYCAEGGGFDCSIGDGYDLSLPHENFVKRLGLKWTGNGADFIDEQGKTVAFDPATYEEGPSALLMHEDALDSFLKENDLVLCWTIVGEKSVVGLNYTHQDSLKFTKLTGAYRFADQSIEGFTKPLSYW